MADAQATKPPEKPAHRKLVERFAERYFIDPDRLLSILKATAFKPRRDKDREPTNEELAALLPELR